MSSITHPVRTQPSARDPRVHHSHLPYEFKTFRDERGMLRTCAVGVHLNKDGERHTYQYSYYETEAESFVSAETRSSGPSSLEDEPGVSAKESHMGQRTLLAQQPPSSKRRNQSECSHISFFGTSLDALDQRPITINRDQIKKWYAARRQDCILKCLGITTTDICQEVIRVFLANVITICAARDGKVNGSLRGSLRLAAGNRYSPHTDALIEICQHTGWFYTRGYTGTSGMIHAVLIMGIDSANILTLESAKAESVVLPGLGEQAVTIKKAD